MKNAKVKVKAKDGKPHKKLRVAKFNFCTIGMPFPFRNNLSAFEYRTPLNNNIIPITKSATNDFTVYPYNDTGPNFQPTASTMISPVSIYHAPQTLIKTTHLDPMQYCDIKSSDDIIPERRSYTLIQRQYPMNQTNDFSNESLKNIESSDKDESNLLSPKYQNENQFIQKNSRSKSYYNNSSTKDEDIVNLNLSVQNISDLDSFHGIIPSSFDIVKRGPLPSIMLGSDGKIKLSSI